MSAVICRRCNGKQQEWGVAAEVCSSQTGLWTIKKVTYYCSCLGHQNEVIVVGGISERRPKSEHFVFIASRIVRIVGLYLLGKEGRELLNEERVVRRPSNTVLWYDTWYLVTYQVKHILRSITRHHVIYGTLVLVVCIKVGVWVGEISLKLLELQ